MLRLTQLAVGIALAVGCEVSVAQDIANVSKYTRDDQGRILKAEGTSADGLATIVEFRFDNNTSVNGQSAFFDTPYFYRITTTKPTSCTDLPATSAMIERYYNTILRRPSDPGGVPYWVGVTVAMCADGAPPEIAFSAIVAAFFHSAEYASFNRSNAEFVDDLYYVLLGRHAEPGGLAYWTSQLDSGARSRDDEMYFILTQSDESKGNMKDAFDGTTSVTGWLLFSDLMVQQ